MTDLQHRICETQAELFEYVAKEGYDLKIFAEEYLSSSFCRRAFDTTYSRFLLEDEQGCLDFILPEIGDKLTKYEDNTVYDPAAASWIGFTYRQLYYETGIMSEELIKKVSFEAMERYYPGLHTVDEDMAFDIIAKDKKLPRNPAWG